MSKERSRVHGPSPSVVSFWLPRRDEHELARSLGMVECSAEEMEGRLEAARSAISKTLPHATIHVGRWHIWRIVRAMVHLGVTNTSDGRAAAAGWLAARADAERQTDDAP